MKGNNIIVSGNGIIKTILSGDFYSFREINILENEFDSIYELDKERIILYNIGDSYFTIMNHIIKRIEKTINVPSTGILMIAPSTEEECFEVLMNDNNKYIYDNKTGNQKRREDFLKHANKSYVGERNSQYGTFWVSKDGLTKKIKKEFLDAYLKDGWIRGRKFK